MHQKLTFITLLSIVSVQVISANHIPTHIGDTPTDNEELSPIENELTELKELGKHEYIRRLTDNDQTTLPTVITTTSNVFDEENDPDASVQPDYYENMEEEAEIDNITTAERVVSTPSAPIPDRVRKSVAQPVASEAVVDESLLELIVKLAENPKAANKVKHLVEELDKQKHQHIPHQNAKYKNAKLTKIGYHENSVDDKESWPFTQTNNTANTLDPAEKHLKPGKTLLVSSNINKQPYIDVSILPKSINASSDGVEIEKRPLNAGGLSVRQNRRRLAEEQRRAKAQKLANASKPPPGTQAPINRRPLEVPDEISPRSRANAGMIFGSQRTNTHPKNQFRGKNRNNYHTGKVVSTVNESKMSTRQRQSLRQRMKDHDDGVSPQTGPYGKVTVDGIEQQLLRLNQKNRGKDKQPQINQPMREMNPTAINAEAQLTSLPSMDRKMKQHQKAKNQLRQKQKQKLRQKNQRKQQKNKNTKEDSINKEVI